MEHFHLTLATLLVIVPAALTAVRFLLKELHEFWLFIRGLRW
jgi:hypothetical protein